MKYIWFIDVNQTVDCIQLQGILFEIEKSRFVILDRLEELSNINDS